MVHSANNSSLLDLSQLPEAERYFIAYSGGMDSTALLHNLVHNNDIDNSQLTAIHINHNINQDAENWAKHCHEFSNSFGIKFISVSVNLNSHSEDACRQARLSVYKQKLNYNDCLITGHHLSDQVETVLFRLLRGSGLQGLIGMSELSNHPGYQIFRPMLYTSKDAIKTYVNQHQLAYINDPSNLDNQYSRNYIRNQLIPLITAKYPEAINNIELTRKNLNQSLNLINVFINKENPYSISQITDVDTLATTLYHWLAQFNITATNHRALKQFSSDCINCAIDKMPHLKMPDWQLKFWRSKIYLLNKENHQNVEAFKINLVSQQFNELPYNLGSIDLSSEKKFNIHATIKFCQNHEKIKLAKHPGRLKIKNLFQENQIPPWERDITPYLYINDELMAVGSDFIAEKFSVLLDKYNAEYQWLSPQLLL
jgi:tRNA(Ile)-lysidine synthase